MRLIGNGRKTYVELRLANHEIQPESIAAAQMEQKTG